MSTPDTNKFPLEFPHPRRPSASPAALHEWIEEFEQQHRRWVTRLSQRIKAIEERLKELENDP